MATMVCDTIIEQRILSERAASGADRYDEVWEGIYMISPMPNDEHQQIVNRMAAIFQEVIDWPGLGHVRPGVNVSDRKDDWTKNYRIPDVAVFLETGSAENCDAFWLGGPDFAVEILSSGDPIQEKIKFYGHVKVRELLVIDRQPWTLQLLRRQGTQLETVALARLDDPPIVSDVLPFEFCLQAGEKRPVIGVMHSDGKAWKV